MSEQNKPSDVAMAFVGKNDAWFAYGSTAEERARIVDAVLGSVNGNAPPLYSAEFVKRVQAFADGWYAYQLSVIDSARRMMVG